MNDLAVGVESSRQFETFCKENPEKAGLGKVDFSVQVLTTGHWPQYKTFQDINLPPLMLRCTETFKEYYDAKTNYRRLTWIHSLGTLTVKGSFAKKSCEMQIATLQAVVLLAFNNDMLGEGPVTFVQLQELTNIPEDVLKKILHSLACAKFKILKKISNEGAADAKASAIIKTTDSFAFNAQFT